LNNNEVSSHEFDTILSEFQQYNFLKDQVRAKMLHQPSTRELPEVDVQKLEKDIRGRLEAEMIKKITKPPASNRISSEKTQNSLFVLSKTGDCAIWHAT